MQGPLFGAFAFDDITTTGNANFNGDFYLARLNAQGDFLWVRETPSESSFTLGYRNFLNLDDNGNVYLCGRASANIDWGNGVVSNGDGLFNTAIILKYNNEGIPIMARTATSEFLTRFDGISLTPQGDIYVAGMAYGQGVFGNLTYTPSEGQQYYPFAAKLGNATAGTGHFDAPVLAVYPNPATDMLYINGINEVTLVGIYTISGQKVKDAEVPASAGIPVNNLPTGIYIIKDATGRVAKFIKQ